jgi:hypothetical protein
MACITSKVMKLKLVMFERRKQNKQKDGNKKPLLNSILKQLFKLKKISKIFEQQTQSRISLDYELHMI